MFIILDKMDKIGLDGVEKELEAEGFDRSSVESYCHWFKNLDESMDVKLSAGIIWMEGLMVRFWIIWIRSFPAHWPTWIFHAGLF